MPIFSKFFFSMYNFLWYIALFFLRRNKRLKDGWGQRNIPEDWLVQNFSVFNNTSIELEKDKPFVGGRIYEEELKNNNSTQNKSLDGVYNVDLWLQAASGGESYLACEFIKALPPSSRRMSILITTWTRQGMQVLEKECVKIIENWKEEALIYKNQNGTSQELQIPYIQIRFAALDQIDIVRRAFDLANPRLCIMLETELWPNFMLVCKEKGIPLYVINARMTKTTYEFYKIINSVLDFISPKHVLATTKDDIDRFSGIFPSALVSYMPNIKFDRAAESINDCISQINEKETTNQDDTSIYSNLINTNTVNMNSLNANLNNTSSNNTGENTRQELGRQVYAEQSESSRRGLTLSREILDKQDNFENKTYLKLLPLLFSKAQTTFLFASIREQEENLLAPVFAKVYSANEGALLIVAPRHMHRVQAWKSRFHDLGMHVVLASEFLQENYEANEFKVFKSHSCVVWDIFGDLPHLYSHVDTVFVGGSFKNLGGQNFLEPLSCGIVPHIGPDLNNFLWAIGDDFPPSLHHVGLLHQYANRRELQAGLLAIQNGKRNENERRDVQLKFLEWLEPRCGASKLAVEKVLADRAFQGFALYSKLFNEKNEQEENVS